MVTKEDLNELRRIATNAYDDDRRFINNLITKIGNMERQISNLQTELKKKNALKK